MTENRSRIKYSSCKNLESARPNLEVVLIRISLVLFLGAAMACASQGSEAAARREDTGGRRDSVAAVAAAGMNEGSAIGLLQLTHSADSALGALGARNGTSTDVKEFGRMILREHVALRRDVEKVASGMSVPIETPRTPPDDAPADLRANLMAAAPGAGWDRSYIEYAIAVHEAALENTARALAATKRPEVRQYIERSVPILQKHIDKAKLLQKRLPNPPATPATPATPR